MPTVSGTPEKHPQNAVFFYVFLTWHLLVVAKTAVFTSQNVPTVTGTLSGPPKYAVFFYVFVTFHFLLFQKQQFLQ